MAAGRRRTATVVSAAVLVTLAMQRATLADTPVPPIATPPGTCPAGSEQCTPVPVGPGAYASYVTAAAGAAQQYEINYTNRTYTDNTGATRALVPCTDYQPISDEQLGLAPSTSVNQAEVDDASYSLSDPGATGALASVGAAIITLQECLDTVSPGTATTGVGTDAVYANRVTLHPVAATAQLLGASSLGSIPTDATPVSDSGRLYTAQSSGGAGPDYFNNVNPNPISHTDLTGVFGYDRDGSNVVMSDFGYDSSRPDRRGRLILMYNGVDVSIGNSTNLYTARANTREYGGPRTIFPGAGASSPINSQTTESSGGYNVSLGFTGSGTYGSFSAGISKEFGQTYSTIDGFNYVDTNNNNHVYQHDGGYRKIAENHHNESRSFGEMAAWIYPPGVQQQWRFGYWLTYKKR